MRLQAEVTSAHALVDFNYKVFLMTSDDPCSPACPVDTGVGRHWPHPWQKSVNSPRNTRLAPS